MTEVITDNVLDRFEQITTYDISKFLSDYLQFIDDDYSKIAIFFSGVSSASPTSSFNSLAQLTKEQKKIVDITILNSVSLDHYEFWALIEYVEDIGQVLETANNMSKWLRSSVTKNGYKQQVRLELMTGQGQGLEEVERVNLKSNDRDGWVDTALENELAEEDYTLGGGHLIKAIYKNSAGLFLNGVVDNIDTAEKTYGLDIDKEIVIENNDLRVLSYQDTILQSAQILAGLRQGDDSAFPDRGIAKNVIGSNLAGVTYPIIFRQLGGNFATDDTFKSFAVKDITREQDIIYCEYSVETRAGDVFNDRVRL